MTSVTVFSPAKINLFLAITGRRPDGFHELVSLVAPLDFGDEITVRRRRGGSDILLECDDPDVPTGLKNLAVQAAEDFRMAAVVSDGFEIRLEKRIPMGAGLGGGSSNAVAVLRALNQLYDGILGEEDLALLASSLGSDCPLFLIGEPCVMRGRGERIERLPPAVLARLSECRVLLFKPGFSIGTGWAYEQLAKFAPASYTEPRLAEAMLGRWMIDHSGPADVLFNSFTMVVDRKFVALPLLADRLRETSGVEGVLLSGSGSAHLAVLGTSADAASAIALIRECLGATAFVAETTIQ